MNPHPPQESSQFMLLVVGYGWNENMPAADATNALNAMMSWVEGLMKQGVATATSPLARMGKIVAGKNGASITDGPFAEAKEVVGGYIIVKAADLDSAAAIAKNCPLLEFGVTLDVREMVHECSISRKLREQEALTAA